MVENVDLRIVAAEKLGAPARRAALDLINPDSRNNAGEVVHFASLDSAARLQALETFAPGWGAALHLAYERRGIIPQVDTYYSIHRSPKNPDHMNAPFWEMIRKSLLWNLPEPIELARAAGSTALELHQGKILGAALDLPGGAGDAAYAALVQAVQSTEGILSAGVCGALASGQRRECWELCFQLHKEYRFGDSNAQGFDNCQEGIMRLKLQRYEELIAAWEAIDWDGMGKSYMKSRVAEMKKWTPRAKVEAALLEAEVRQKIFEEGTPAEISSALKVQASIELMDIAQVIEKFIKAPQGWKRAMGVDATSYLSVGFPGEMLDDPEEVVRIACIWRHERAVVGSTPQDKAAHTDRLLRVLEKLKGKRVTIHIPQALGFDPTGPEWVLSLLIFYGWILPKPLDPLVGYMTVMFEQTREVLSGLIARLPELAGRAPTETEIGMLGLLAAERKGNIKKNALAAIEKLGLSLKQCKEAAAKIATLAAAAEPVKAGPWGKLLQKRASTSGGELRFGAAADESQIAKLEQQLKLTIPAALRELLLEMDSVSVDGDHPLEIAAIVDLAALTKAAGDAAREHDRPQAMDGVLFLWDMGDGDLMGICTRELGKHKSGEIVRFDHETGKLVKEARDLRAWVNQKPG